MEEKVAEPIKRRESKTDAPENPEDTASCTASGRLAARTTLREWESWLCLSFIECLSFWLFTLIFPLLRLANPFLFSHELVLCCLFSSCWHVFLRHSYLGCFFVTCPQSDLMLFLFHCGQKTSAVRLQPFEIHWVYIIISTWSIRVTILCAWKTSVHSAVVGYSAQWMLIRLIRMLVLFR